MKIQPSEALVLTEYAELKREEKTLAKKIEECAVKVKDLMEKFGVEEVNTNDGKFTIEARKVWTYPEEIVQLDDAVKAQKKEAEQKGWATYEAKEFVKFYAQKPTNRG